MKQLYLKSVLLCLCLLPGINASAYDFEKDGIYYNFVSEDEVEVVCSESYDEYGDLIPDYSGAVVIPPSVTYDGNTYDVRGIVDSAFEGCSGMTSISIPESVTYIGMWAFNGCSSLASLTIPQNVTSIGWSTFNGCSSLTSIDIPDGVVVICQGAFNDCTNLSSITIPNSVETIGRDAFKGTAWYNNKPNGLVYAGKVAYKYKGTMPEGTHIDIEDGTVAIAGGAFDGCAGLTSISIPNGVKNIGFDEGMHMGGGDAEGGAFANCTNLTTITLPNSVEDIGTAAFYNCTSLTSITIPGSVEWISEYAFHRCANLTSVASKITEPYSFEDDVFSDIASNCMLTVPEGTLDAYLAAGWTTDVFGGGVFEEVLAPVSSAGMATFYHADGNLNIPEGVSAYTATVSNGSVSLNKIEGTIPAGTPVVLKGAADTYSFSYTPNAEAVGTNNLGYTTEQLTADGTQYVLANRMSHGVGFYKVKAGTTIPVGKVYLKVSSLGIKEFFGFEDNATGIETFSNAPLKGENIYNLAGQRITKMQKGINIINGKKVLK